MPVPASATLLIDTIDGVLSLSSLKAYIQKLNLNAAGSIVENLGGLSIIGIGVGILLMFILLLSMALRHPKIIGYVERIKLFFMWNFCIRYY